MNNKFLIFNADDFGISKSINDCILDGYQNGFLRSASLCANGSAFCDAVENVIAKCLQMSVGVHLNISDGALLAKNSLLQEINDGSNKSFIKAMFRSSDKIFLAAVEEEFRAQIEKCLKFTSITHLDSHRHIHAIPNIFKVATKLAKEYKIPYIRTQREKLYFIPNLKSHLSTVYPVNLIKNFLLNFYTDSNKMILNGTNLKTNDFLVGVCYSSIMNYESIKYGIKTIGKNCTVEILIHPKTLADKDHQIVKNETLKNEIAKMGFKITTYSEMLLL
ncbi:MAG: ChbG/HpnK family deacetylase [Elusimicrobiota bacterium]|nr:ChbG/HpnK family deacetylase [Elusimicrobiota bacterium]